MATHDIPLGREDRLWLEFDNLLHSYGCDCTAYVYRLDARGHPIRPYWLKGDATPNLITSIQSKGGGRVRIIVRRGRTIVFSGRLAFARLPLNTYAIV